VQRRLNGLGFDTKVTGKFDEQTRAVITRWQAARGYPSSGFLNKLQHKAMLSEIVATTSTASSSDEGERPARRRASSGGGGGGGGGGHRGGGGGDPAGAGRFIGGVMGGILR
jgi:peptidoglycan hydrolase-like protein with peptidoglycan-binding domain